MSEQSHKHEQHGHGNKPTSTNWMLHKDWRAWVAVIIMLAAIAMYVLSLDDSIVPR